MAAAASEEVEGTPPVTFTFLSSWGVLAKTCDAVPPGTVDERHRYHHHPTLAPQDAPAARAPTVRNVRQEAGMASKSLRGRGGRGKRGRAQTGIPRVNDTVDVDLLSEDSLNATDALDGPLAAEDAQLHHSQLDQHNARVLPPTEVLCVVHFVDHAAQRGRTESFPMPMHSVASELYESVRWWLGDERIVLFDIIHRGQEDLGARHQSTASTQGAVGNIITPGQPLGYLPSLSNGNTDGVEHVAALCDRLHPMCRTTLMVNGDWEGSPTMDTPRRRRRHHTTAVFRHIGCQRTTVLAEDVDRWAAVYTFLPRGHGDACGVSWGLPPVVVPITTCRGAGGEPSEDANTDAAVATRAVAGAAVVCCATYKARQFFTRCPAMVRPADVQLQQEVVLSTPVEVLVGYPAFTVGDIVEWVGRHTTAATSPAQRTQSNDNAVLLQVESVDDSDHSGLPLYYGRDLLTGRHYGPLLCSQLAAVGATDG